VANPQTNPTRFNIGNPSSNFQPEERVQLPIHACHQLKLQLYPRKSPAE
jgi:hypothetical protein